MKSELTIDKYGTKICKLPNGQLHREDGPAIEYSDGTKRWCLNGVSYTEQEYKNEMRSIKLNNLLK